MQANLARNSEYLQSQGVYYPVMSESERNPHISSGNGYLLSNGELPAPPEGTDIYLVSAEQLYRSFVNNATIAGNLMSSAKSLGAARIEFILYVRDPIDHAESAFQQSIKRGGGTEEPEDFFKRYRTPKLVARFKDTIAALDNADLHIFNYSRYSRDALNPILKLIGIDTLPVSDTLNVRINRSLTRDELELQRYLNTHLGREAAFLSDTFCNTLPNVKSDKMYPDAAAQMDLIAQSSQYLDEVDEILPDGEKYDRTTRNADPKPENLAFSYDQTNAIAEALALQIKLHKYDASYAKARLNLQQARATKDPERSLSFATTALELVSSIDQTATGHARLDALVRQTEEFRRQVQKYLDDSGH